MLYSRFGLRVTVQRLAKIEDFGGRPSKVDHEAIKNDAYVIVNLGPDDTLRLYPVSDLKADNGIVEINAVLAACKANGGVAP